MKEARDDRKRRIEKERIKLRHSGENKRRTMF